MYSIISAPFRLKHLALLTLATLALTGCPDRHDNEDSAASDSDLSLLKKQIADENAFARKDTDKNGKLSFAETEVVLPGLTQARFNALDKNNDLWLSEDELSIPMPVRKLEMASPEWPDQILYFLMTDRFNDGDPTNNQQAQLDYDPKLDSKYHGGDLVGIQQKLDYIKGLGATGIWITPPVANQWWDPLAGYGGYHGYWAQNFTEVDPHVGTLADYRNLSSALHEQGMYLIQDIVVNHTGNFFSYRDGYDAADPAKGVTLNTASEPLNAVIQSPFNQNNPGNANDRTAGIYHWTPSINNYQDEVQEQTYQLSDLDDLNTENPVVQKALRDSYNYWIREVGVDGFRIDTVFYVKPEFFKDFLYSTDPNSLGINLTAEQTGRTNFLSFGEGFASDKAFEDTKAKKIDSYMTDQAGKQELLPGMINFPLYTTAGDVFARGRPTAELAYRIDSMMSLHKRPQLMPSFLDNHDVDRFLAGGSEAALKQNLLLMMTLPGIPVIYYGTEQGFKKQRQPMFKTSAEGSVDHFDTSAPLYQYVQKLTNLRKNNRIFSRGTPSILKSNLARSGAFAYQMKLDNAQVFVVYNTSDTETLLEHMPTGLPANSLLAPLAAIDGTATAQQVDAQGQLSMKLPARSGYVWAATTQTGPAPGQKMTLTLPELAAKQTDDIALSGKVSGIIAPFKLVLDGDIAHAQTVTPEEDGSWSATVSIGAMADPKIHHSLIAWHEASNSLSASQTFTAEPNIQVLAEVTDPALDDTGPTGYQYQHPTDPSWGDNHQMDIRKVKVSAVGTSLQVDVQTNKVTTVWNPANGFDHVAFTLFVEVPGQPAGQTILPLQNASLPSGMTWHYRMRAHGWSNTWTSAVGASATNEGTSVSPTASISVNAETNTVSFKLSAEALGKPASLSGIRLYLNTWDYDNGYRGLDIAPAQWQFSGGKTTDPRIMDDTGIIQLQLD